MNLHIEFFNEKSRIDWATCDRTVPLELFDGTNYLKGCPIKWGKQDTIFIEARLENFGHEDVDELFQLSLAFQPDYQPLSDEQGRFFYEDRDSNNKVRRVRRMPLLRGAAGKSYLRLLRRSSTASEAEFQEIIRYEIYVEPAPSKKAAMDLMVDELL